MGHQDEKPSGLPTSMPDVSTPDSGWDDEFDPVTEPGGDLFEDTGDRITAIPEVPMSDLARDLMAMAEPDRDSGPRFESPGPRGSPRQDRPVGSMNPADPDLLADTLEFELDPAWERSRAAMRPAARDADRHQGMSETSPASNKQFLNTEEPFDFDDPPPRDEMPTLDISEEMGEVLSMSAFADKGRRDPSELQLDFADLGFVAPEPTSAPSAALSLPQRSGLELATEPPPAHASEDLAYRELHDRYAVGDFTGALSIAESLLDRDAEDIEAKRYAQSCRDVLMQMYSARLGSLDQVVNVTIPPDQIRWLSLDHRAGFLLSLVDGASSVDDILDICCMPRLDALRIMYQLLEQHVISVGPQ